MGLLGEDTNTSKFQRKYSHLQIAFETICFEMNMTYSGMLNWLDISTFYFYEQLLFQIFFPWKFTKTYGLPLSTIAFTVNSHTDSHIYQSIYSFQILYSMELVFFYQNIHKCFFIQIWFKSETPLLFFSNKSQGLQKQTLYRKNSFFFCRLC